MGAEYEKRGVGQIGLYILFFAVLSAGVFIFINIKIAPFVLSVAKGYANNAVSNVLNDIVNDAMREESYNFINIINDSEGKIAAVTMNSADTNLFITKITIGLKERIADMDEIEAKIPLGNFCPYPFLTGLGPKVKVRFLILANSNVTAKESFEAKGINQTLYTLSFHVDTRVGIYIPGMNSSVMVENEMPIAQTLIVGSVPDNYTNVEGMDGTVQDTVLDIE